MVEYIGIYTYICLECYPFQKCYWQPLSKHCLRLSPHMCPSMLSGYIQAPFQAATPNLTHVLNMSLQLTHSVYNQALIRDTRQDISGLRH